MMTTASDLERQVVESVSTERLMEDVRHLSTLERHSGTEDERRAAEYVRDRLTSLGIDTRIHTFRSYLSHPHSARLEILTPERFEVPTATRAFSISVPEGVEAELVDVGAGDPADFERVDVRGKFALADQGGPETVRHAQLAGALGTVHIWASDEDAVHEGIVTTIWGTPTPDNADRIPAIQAVQVKRRDGLRLRALCANGPVRVKVSTHTETGWREVPLVEARIPGQTDDFLLIASHLDSWYYGTTDNATGNAAGMELARVFHAVRDQLKRGVRVCWWPGHSTGRYSGSTWYADHFWEDLQGHCVGYLNMDSPGAQGATDYTWQSVMPENRAYASAVIERYTGQRIEELRGPSRAGDQSFWGHGLPSFYVLFSQRPKGERWAVSGCGMNWWWHTPADTVETADPQILTLDTRIYAATALGVLNADVLPYDYAELADELLKTLNGLSEKAGNHLDLARPIALATELREAVGALNAAAERARAAGDTGALARIDRAVFQLTRLLVPIWMTEAGPYEHDPATPMPRLALLQPAARLATLDPASNAYGFLQTKLVRNRNRVVHHLKQAVEAARAAAG